MNNLTKSYEKLAPFQCVRLCYLSESGLATSPRLRTLAHVNNTHPHIQVCASTRPNQIRCRVWSEPISSLWLVGCAHVRIGFGQTDRSIDHSANTLDTTSYVRVRHWTAFFVHHDGKRINYAQDFCWHYAAIVWDIQRIYSIKRHYTTEARWTSPFETQQIRWRATV